MQNSKSQAGTEVEKSTQAEVSTSSPNNAKPNVGCCFSSHKDEGHKIKNMNKNIDKGLSDFISNIEIKRTNGIAEIIVDYFNNDRSKPIRLIGFSTNANNSDYEIAEEGYHYYQSLKLEIEQ